MIEIKVRKVSQFAEVVITPNSGYVINPGLLDESEAYELIFSFLDASEDLLSVFHCRDLAERLSELKYEVGHITTVEPAKPA